MDLNPDELKSKSYDELRQMEKTLASELEAKRTEARQSALETIVELIVEFEITPDELNKAADGKVKPAKGKSKKDGRSKVPPKYRNPENPEQTWTGRGVAPVWIRDTPKEDRDKFLIENLDKNKGTDEKPAAKPAETKQTSTPDADADEGTTAPDEVPATAALGFSTGDAEAG